MTVPATHHQPAAASAKKQHTDTHSAHSSCGKERATQKEHLGNTTANSTPAGAYSNGNSNGNPATSIMICRNKHYPYIASYHGPWLSLPLELLQSLFTLNSDVTTAPPPPPIDPIIFRHLIHIRTLVDEASETVIKAAGGQSMRGSSGTNPLGIPMNSRDGGGFSSARMSAIRQHRLREIAVAKLASAYRCDEIATSVLTMQSASALDDVAVKVLKRDPHNMDAIYVHHFHEKIPSRMLATSTDCTAIDKLIAAYPTIPEFFRTRAMIHSFREEFPLALRDFKTAIALAKKRKRNVNGVDCEALVHGGQESKQAFHVESDQEGVCSEALLYFLRGACFHQYAIHLIDKAIDKVNDTYFAEQRRRKNKKKKKGRANRAAAAANANGTTPTPPLEMATTASPTSSSPSSATAPAPTGAETALPTWQDYRDAMQPSSQLIETLAKRSIRDYHHFLSYYPHSLDPFAFAPSPANNTTNHSPPSPHTEAHVPAAAESDSSPPIATMPAFINSITHKSLTKLQCAAVGAQQPGGSPPGTPGLEVDKYARVERADRADGGVGQRMEPRIDGVAQRMQSPSPPPEMASLGTYHPLLLEAWFSLGVNYMLTRDWRTTAAWHDRISLLQDQVEGYPVFLPARSMSQADYIEILTLLRKAARERGGKRGAGGGAANGNTADGKPHREASTRDTDGNACNGTGSGQHTPPISVTHTTPATKPTTYCCECMSHPRTATGRESALIVSQANPTHNHTDSISSSSSSSSTSPFSMTNSAFSTSAGSNSTIKQYPLHTKRAQTVAMWLQAMVLIERGEGVGSEAGVNGSSVNGIGVNGTGVNGTGAKPTVASIEAQLRDVQDQIKVLEDKTRELLAIRQLETRTGARA